MAKYCETKIHEVPPTRVDLQWFSNRARRTHDFPGFVNGTMALGMLQKASNTGSRAILNGVGGDEWLGGSRMYYAEELAKLQWRSLFSCLGSDLAALGLSETMRIFLRNGVFELLPSKTKELLRCFRRYLSGDFDLKDANWLSLSFRHLIFERRRYYKNIQGRRVEKIGQREMLATLNDAYLGLAREEGERLYAEFRLEPRRPLHTAKFVQFAFSTPARLRFNGIRDKYIHVESLRGLMPSEICDRITKSQFQGMFQPLLSKAKQHLIYEIPRRRTKLLSMEGMAQLSRAYECREQQGGPMWAMWSVYGCDEMLTASENLIQSMPK